jgi:DNA polymerase
MEMVISVPSIKHTVDGIARYLEYAMEEDKREVEVSTSVLKELSVPPSIVRVKQLVPAAGGAGEQVSVEKELKKIADAVASCRTCSLHKTRTNVVPGQGASHPEIMFVWEAPGGDEDLQGLAFVGRAGQLLTKMIEAMGFRREDVFIGNILKCRPPGNRTPLPEEMEMCLPFLKSQIALIRPKVIIALGSTAVKGLLGLSTGITRLRGKWFSFQDIDLMPTYHPAYLLRNPSAKKEVWEDLQEVLKHLGRTPPRRKQ